MLMKLYELYITVMQFFPNHPDIHTYCGIKNKNRQSLRKDSCELILLNCFFYYLSIKEIRDSWTCIFNALNIMKIVYKWGQIDYYYIFLLLICQNCPCFSSLYDALTSSLCCQCVVTFLRRCTTGWVFYFRAPLALAWCRSINQALLNVTIYLKLQKAHSSVSDKRFNGPN